MRVTSSYFECDTCIVLLSEIEAILLVDVGKAHRRFVIHTKSGLSIELPLSIALHFRDDIQCFKKYLKL